MLEIMIARSLHVYPSPGGGWTCALSGTRVPMVRPPKPTPLEAVEAAEEALVSTDQRRERQRADRLFDLLQTGEVYVVPREVVDPEGGKQQVFDVVRRDGIATPIQGRGSYKQALIDWEASRQQQAQAQGREVAV
jgi:hypothetical protein